MDRRMTVALACKHMRLLISRIICILRDEKMTELADEIETAVDSITRQIDTDKQHIEYGQLSTLEGRCLSIIQEDKKLAVIFYGPIELRD